MTSRAGASVVCTICASECECETKLALSIPHALRRPSSQPIMGMLGQARGMCSHQRRLVPVGSGKGEIERESVRTFERCRSKKNEAC
jgi:hypothetical protein